MKRLRLTHVVIVVLVVFALYYTFVIAQDIKFQLSGATVVDDTFYYLGYARNLATGHGPTFDGIVQTNGVQPLWTLILLLPALIITDRIVLMRAALIFAAAFDLVSLYLVWRTLCRLIEAKFALFGILVYGSYLTITRVALCAMDNSIHLVTFSLMLYVLVTRILQNEDVKRQDSLLLGGTLILISLSRIDNLVIVPFVLLIVWLKLKSWQKVGLTAAPVIALMTLYFLLNYSAFGVALPMSGEVKAAYYEQTLTQTFHSRFDPAYILFTLQDGINEVGILLSWIVGPLLLSKNLFPFSIGLILVFVIAVTFTAIRRILNRHRQRLSFSYWWLVILTIGIVAHIYAFYWQMGRYYVSWQRWYYSPEILVILVWIALAFSLLATRRFVLLIGYSYTVAAIVLGMLRLDENFQTRAANMSLYAFYQGAATVDAQIPKGAVVGAWNSGVIGYFTETTVINLDGLMNDKNRLETIRTRAPIRTYLDAHHITYVMDYVIGTEPPKETDQIFGLQPGTFRILWTQPFLDIEAQFNAWLILLKLEPNLTAVQP